MSGSYFVRCSSSDRSQGTVANFTVDCSQHDQLQNVRGISVNLISFPNTQPNISLGKTDLALGFETAPGVPAYRTTQEIPAASYLQLAIAGIYNAVFFPATIPAGSLCTSVAATINAQFALSFNFSAVGAICTWIPAGNAGYFQFDYMIGAPTIQVAPPNTPFASSFVLYAQMGLVVTAAPVPVPFNQDNIVASRAAVPWRIISVASGQYDVVALAAAITAAVLLAQPLSGFLCVVDNLAFNPRFHFTSTSQIRYFSRQSSYGESTLSRWLGITQPSALFTLDYVANSPPNLAGVQIVSVQSQTLTLGRAIQARDNEINVASVALSTMCEIPVGGIPFGEWVHYQPTVEQQYEFSSAKNITSISYSFRDAQNDGEELYGMCEPGAHILLEVLSAN